MYILPNKNQFFNSIILSKKTITIILVFFQISCASSQSITGEESQLKEYKKVEKKLDNIYEKLKAELPEKDQKNLIEAQLAWGKFRDSNCKFKSQENEDSGPLEYKMKIDCLIQITSERIKELEELIGGL